MTIEKIIEYVLHTPHNTNKAILAEMLKQLIEENGGSSEGKEIVYDGGTEV